MKPVAAVYRASFTDYSGLSTWRVMPTRNLPIEALEPFIFLNHHGPQVFPENNEGLPFGPHPHKGFETVTFIVDGELVHSDSTGFSSNIKKGGIQWMTAGKGIIHSETSSDEFLQKGGPLEILQLWINLPARLKNVEPAYTGLQKDQVPEIKVNDLVTINLVSGKFNEHTGPIQSISDVHLSTIDLKNKGKLSLEVPSSRTVLFYVVKGQLQVNGSAVSAQETVEFDRSGELIQIEAEDDSLIIFGHAEPNREPIVAHGPFVMNTQEEIREAFLQFS
ncbi:MAG: pirin family protein [Flavitalea sp.]